jgi:hypothetical protein
VGTFLSVVLFLSAFIVPFVVWVRLMRNAVPFAGLIALVTFPVLIGLGVFVGQVDRALDSEYCETQGREWASPNSYYVERCIK